MSERHTACVESACVCAAAQSNSEQRQTATAQRDTMSGLRRKIGGDAPAAHARLPPPVLRHFHPSKYFTTQPVPFSPKKPTAKRGVTTRSPSLRCVRVTLRAGSGCDGRGAGGADAGTAHLADALVATQVLDVRGQRFIEGRLRVGAGSRMDKRSSERAVRSATSAGVRRGSAGRSSAWRLSARLSTRACVRRCLFLATQAFFFAVWYEGRGAVPPVQSRPRAPA